MDRAIGLAPGDCWPWPGARHEFGYGRIKTTGDEQEYVHRIVLAAKLGRPLLAGEQTRHSCDNPPCFNPEHLEVGTAQDNVNDMMARGRHWAQQADRSN